MTMKVKAVEKKLKFTKNENDPGGHALTSGQRMKRIPGANTWDFIYKMYAREKNSLLTMVF